VLKVSVFATFEAAKSKGKMIAEIIKRSRKTHNRSRKPFVARDNVNLGLSCGNTLAFTGENCGGKRPCPNAS
jgi:ABC-type polysaccharide/polyol phosphate transport system ATPase subunit